MTRFVPSFPPRSVAGMLLLAAATASAAAVAPATAPGHVLRYVAEPGSTRTYLREQTDRVIQTVNGRQLGTEIRGTWRLDASFEPTSADSLSIVVRHDSLAITEGGSPIQADLAALYGLPVIVVLDRRGRVADVEVPDSLPPAAARLDLGATYRTFFPRLPEGEAAAGAAWADTTAATAVQAGLELRVRRVNRYVSQGWTTQGERRVVRVDYETELTIDGSGDQEQAGIVLSGVGQGTGGYAFDPEEGAFVSGGETMEMRMVALVSTQDGQNLVIPIVQNRSLTVTTVDSR